METAVVDLVCGFCINLYMATFGLGKVLPKTTIPPAIHLPIVTTEDTPCELVALINSNLLSLDPPFDLPLPLDHGDFQVRK